MKQAHTQSKNLKIFGIMVESIVRDTKSPKKLRQKLNLPGQLQSQAKSSRNPLLPKVNLFPN